MYAFHSLTSRSVCHSVVVRLLSCSCQNMDNVLNVGIQQDLDAYVVELRRKYGAGIIEIVSPYGSSSPTGAQQILLLQQDGAPAKIQNGERSALEISAAGGSDSPSGLKLLELVRLYNAADVAIFSTFFQGLNLLPYECTASQGSSTPCAMIISEFMGCSRSLNGVLRVNPWSLEMISEALHQAMSMSNDERRANHARRFNYVMNHNVERWAATFLEQLARATKLGAELNYVQVGSGASSKLLGLKSNFVHLPMSLLSNTYSAAELRVILLDYDGTLIPADKSAAAEDCMMGPPVGVIRLLKFLSDQPDTVVFLMSGRTRTVLSQWFADLPNLGLAAEKGLFLRWPARLANACRFDKKVSSSSIDEEPEQETVLSSLHPHQGTVSEDSSSSDDDSDEESEDDCEADVSRPRPLHPSARAPSRTAASMLSSTALCGPVSCDLEWECIVPLADISWKSTALEIIKSYTEQTDGSWIEDKEFAIVWHYEQADVEYGRMQSADLQKAASPPASAQLPWAGDVAPPAAPSAASVAAAAAGLSSWSRSTSPYSDLSTPSTSLT